MPSRTPWHGSIDEQGRKSSASSTADTASYDDASSVSPTDIAPSDDESSVSSTESVFSDKEDQSSASSHVARQERNPKTNSADNELSLARVYLDHIARPVSTRQPSLKERLKNTMKQLAATHLSNESDRIACQFRIATFCEQLQMTEQRRSVITYFLEPKCNAPINALLSKTVFTIEQLWTLLTHVQLDTLKVLVNNIQALLTCVDYSHFRHAELDKTLLSAACTKKAEDFFAVLNHVTDFVIAVRSIGQLLTNQSKFMMMPDTVSKKDRCELKNKYALSVSGILSLETYGRPIFSALDQWNRARNSFIKRAKLQGKPLRQLQQWSFHAHQQLFFTIKSQARDQQKVIDIINALKTALLNAMALPQPEAPSKRNKKRKRNYSI